MREMVSKTRIILKILNLYMSKNIDLIAYRLATTSGSIIPPLGTQAKPG